MFVARSRSTRGSRRAALGVTLIELMIAVAIVGILAAIAYPSYQAQVRRGNRTDGKAELMEASQELEKCFTRFGVYNNGNCNVFARVTNGTRVSEKGLYVLSFGAVDDATTKYKLIATLQPGHGVDAECPTMTLDQAGTRGNTGTGTAATCW